MGLQGRLQGKGGRGTQVHYRNQVVLSGCISRAEAAETWGGVYIIFVTKQHACSETKSFRSICFLLLAICSLQINALCQSNYSFPERRAHVSYDNPGLGDY
jgi:hypothetical protein